MPFSRLPQRKLEDSRLPEDDGTQLSVMSKRDVAMATVRQTDMEPLSAH